MMAGKGTPWYPSMRLLRQTKADDWSGVVRRMHDELQWRGL
jgi:hypothetical protein